MTIPFLVPKVKSTEGRSGRMLLHFQQAKGFEAPVIKGVTESDDETVVGSPQGRCGWAALLAVS